MLLLLHCWGNASLLGVKRATKQKVSGKEKIFKNTVKKSN